MSILTPRTCIGDGCTRTVKLTMMCPVHTRRFDKYGDMDYIPKPAEKIYCYVENCKSIAHGKGLCSSHYMMKWRYGDATHEPLKTHGMSGSSEYNSWRNMRDRCRLTYDKAYSRYGGRGIKVCNYWYESFDNFYADMGDKPTPKHTIDREDSNANYSCGHCDECIANNWSANCRWVTSDIQSWNKRKSSRNTSGYIGVSKTKWGWSSGIGVKIDGKTKYFNLGSFQDIEEAALEYDKAAIFFRGEYAVTNILKL